MGTGWGLGTEGGWGAAWQVCGISRGQGKQAVRKALHRHLESGKENTSHDAEQAWGWRCWGVATVLHLSFGHPSILPRVLAAALLS